MSLRARRTRGAVVGAVMAASIAAAGLARAEADRAPLLVDRVYARFDAPETGGPDRPRYVFEREMAFEARLEALADFERAERTAAYLDRHVRAAFERHVAEELLAQLPIDPEPAPSDVAARVASAREVLEQRVGGAAALDRAAVAEGLAPAEVDRFVRREARASLYIDRMVAPILEPNDAELREVHRGTNPFHGRPFAEVKLPLRRWYLGERLDAALQTFFQNARARVHVTFLTGA